MAHPDERTELSLEEIEKFVAESRRNGVTIVILGELGVGKSTLVNGIIGRNAIDRKRANTVRSPSGITQNVEKYEVKSACGDTILKVFDTPGLCDPKRDKVKVFSELTKSTEGRIDLLVYCYDMRSKVRDTFANEIGYLANILRKGSSAAETDLWENVICVLTFANKVANDIKEDEEYERRGQGEREVLESTKQKFKKLLAEYCDELRNEIQKVVGETDTVIPVVPAGYRATSLPNCEDWLTSLWKTALSRVKSAAAPAFIEITALHRVQPAGAGPDRSETEPAQRNLDDDGLRAINRLGMRATLVGSATAVAGFGVKLGASVVGTKAAGGALATIAGLGTVAGVFGLGVAAVGVGALLYVAHKKHEAGKKKKEQ